MCFLTHLILRIISSALTIFSNSLCSSSDTLSSFLSSVIRLSFSWRNNLIRGTTILLMLVETWRKEEHFQTSMRTRSCMYEYPSNSIRLSLKCPENWSICLLFKLMYLGLHITQYPRVWKSTNGPFIPSNTPPLLHPGFDVMAVDHHRFLQPVHGRSDC